jgi:hypothetical protein
VESHYAREYHNHRGSRMKSVTRHVNVVTKKTSSLPSLYLHRRRPLCYKRCHEKNAYGRSTQNYIPSQQKEVLRLNRSTLAMPRYRQNRKINTKHAGEACDEDTSATSAIRTGMNNVQGEAAQTNLCNFSTTNIVYAETKPICQIEITVWT